MESRKILHSAIISILLIFGTGGAAFAQVSGFFAEISGQASGPHDEAALRQLVNTGSLTRTSLVWREGMPGWTPAGAVAELEPLFAGVPPPLPGTQPAPPPLPDAPPSIWADQFAIQPAQAGFQDFTMGERWGTFLLNAVIPGLGSFVIMQDRAGALFNIALGVGAYACYILYFSTMSWHWQTGWRRFPVFWIAGAGLHLGQFVHNAVRSFTYNRPLPPGIALILDNDALDIAFIPGQNGRTKLALTFTLQY